MEKFSVHMKIIFFLVLVAMMVCNQLTCDHTLYPFFKSMHKYTTGDSEAKNFFSVTAAV